MTIENVTMCVWFLATEPLSFRGAGPHNWASVRRCRPVGTRRPEAWHRRTISEFSLSWLGPGEVIFGTKVSQKGQKIVLG